MKFGLGNAGVVSTLAVNIALIIGFAISITSKLDHIASTSAGNCLLLRSAIVLSIEESANAAPTPHPGTVDRIERNFSNIACR